MFKSALESLTLFQLQKKNNRRRDHYSCSFNFLMVLLLSFKSVLLK